MFMETMHENIHQKKDNPTTSNRQDPKPWLHKLPPELQLAIWSMAYEADRQIFEIQADHVHLPWVARVLPVPHIMWAHPIARAAVLAANMEVESDQRLGHLSRDGLYSNGDRRFWFDPFRDTLYWNARRSWCPHWHCPDLRYLMIPACSIEFLDLGHLREVFFSELKEIKVYMGGIDLDFRASDDDEHVRHVEVDLQDTALVNEVARVAHKYMIARSFKSCATVADLNVAEEWEILVSNTRDHNWEDPLYQRNRCWESRHTVPCHYTSLDKERQHWLPLTPGCGENWRETQWFIECTFVGFERWHELSGDHPVDSGPTELSIAHTKQFYEHLETMPRVRRVAIVKLLGNVGGLWLEHAVGVGRTSNRPSFQPSDN